MDAAIDLNDFLLESDPYRHTFPTLELEGSIEYYLDVKHPVSLAETKIRQVISEIAPTFAIVVEFISFNTYTSVFDPAGPQKHPLISISASFSAQVTLWKDAAKVLHSIFKEMNIGSPFVEIVCHERSWRLTIDPILKATGIEVAASWEKVKPEIIQALDENLLSKDARWSNVCVFMCTTRDYPKTKLPTIVVSIAYPAKKDWQKVITAIKGILSSKHVNNIRVEFVYGGLEFSYSNYDNALDLYGFSTETVSSNSFGVDNREGSGSVGGCILLDDPRYKD